MNTKNNEKKLIAVIGATGQQGGGVVRALQASGQFNVRALRNYSCITPRLPIEEVSTPEKNQLLIGKL